MMKVIVMSVVLCGEETWTLRKMTSKHLKHSRCGCGEEWKISVGGQNLPQMRKS